jgi:cyclopropane fatty-acyl-phospholipid synthase-like methyltransferase
LREVLYRLLVEPVRWMNRAIRSLSAGAHFFQYKLEGALRPSAEWFDHQLDAQWQWPRLGRSGFLERGVLSALTLRPGGAALELCCGGGFNTRYFYAPRVARIVAVDANREALRHARRFNGAPNISYEFCDVTRSIPPGPFDNIVWDTAIHHFTREEAIAILGRVREALAPGGTLSGHTVIEPGSTYAYARQAFKGPHDLADLLGQVFPHVLVRTTPDPARLNLYFFAGDEARSLPFDPARDDVVVAPRDR